MVRIRAGVTERRAERTTTGLLHSSTVAENIYVSFSNPKRVFQIFVCIVRLRNLTHLTTGHPITAIRDDRLDA
ncbi:hypothetical protein [Methylobacterium sp. J-077]|uniref:hypothetical protein n=1 Tax=Methylobacterium sp. J-077 TaxID=2836656 RepID=UPI001FBA85FB|nr:hypothetical protein [Methylobacterium sp. J-077]MCJ2123927.1 hypothetical protein [Methylobacterium sp. J-077]